MYSKRMKTLTLQNDFESAGAQMKALRLALFMTQQQFAQELGLKSYVSVNYFENGKRRIPAQTIVICGYLEKSLRGSKKNSKKA